MVLNDGGERRRVLVIGLDGATYRLIDPLRQAGQLPNLDRLMRAGAAGVLRSTIQPSSEQAWATFMTGQNNGRHGIFGFQRRRPATYQFEYVNAASLRAPTLWRRLSELGHDVIVINVPMTYPPEPVRGVLVGGLLSPGVHSQFTYPAGVYEELRQACGAYVIDVDTERGRLSNAQLARLAEDGVATIGMRTGAALHLGQTRPWDFLMVVYEASDRLAHKFWKYWDQRHPLHEPASAALFGDVLPRIYRELDAAVGQLVGSLVDESTTVFLVSDHGFGPLEKAVYLNRWLAHKGYLALKPSGQRSPSEQARVVLRGALRRAVRYLDRPIVAGAKQRAFERFPDLKGALYSSVAFADVDWSHTQAYAVGTMGNIYLNRQGREPEGIVAPGAEAEAVIARLMADLQTLCDPDTGAPVFFSVFRGAELYDGPALADAPDVVCVKESRYHVVTADWQGGERFVEPLGQALHFVSDQSGQHELDGVLVAAGPGIRPGARVNGARLVDMAATIVHALGETVPADMDSRPITDLYTEAWLRANPPLVADQAPVVAFSDDGASAEDSYSADEKALLEAHLASLGYLD